MLLVLASLDGVAKGGQVVDRESGKAIPGAYVFATWWGRSENVVQGQTRCYSFAMVRADGDGRFDLPESAPDFAPLLLTQRSRHLTAYAPGYEEYPIRRGNTGKLEMRRFEGAVALRLSNLVNSLPYGCVPEAKEAQLIPLFEAMNDEAQSIAKSEQELRYAKQMQAALTHMKKSRGAQ